MIRIVLAGAPRGKGRPRFTGNPIQRTTKDGKSWKQFAFPDKQTLTYESELRWAARIEMSDRAPLLGPLCVVMVASVPIPKSLSKARRAAAIEGRLRPITKPDWDNFGKVVDSLNKIVWDDDAQVVDGRVIKLYSEKPQMEIIVTELTDLFG